ARGGGSLIEDTINPLTANPAGTPLGMNLVKSGAGTLTLGGNNTYRGTTTVSQGVLKVVSNNALGQPLGLTTGSTTVNAGAELQIGANVAGGTLAIDDELITLSGTGYVGNQTGSGANVGALHVLQGVSASLGGGATTITLNSAQNTIGVESGSTLVMDGQFAAGGGQLGVNTSPVNKVGAGTLEIRGGLANSNVGTFTINDGTVRLNKRPGTGGNVGPAFIVGDNAGSANSDILELSTPGQLSSSTGVTVNSTGLLKKSAAPSATTQNEVQNVVVTGTSGSFQVTYNGSSTAPLPFNIPPTGRFFSASNEIQQITNQNGNVQGAFRILFRTSTTAAAFVTGNILSIASAADVQTALENAVNPSSATIGQGNVLVDG